MKLVEHIIEYAMGLFSLSVRNFLLVLIALATCLVQCSENVLFRKNKETYLPNHVIETKKARYDMECALFCVRRASCTSINYKTSGVGEGLCELNNDIPQQNSTEEDHKTYRLAEFTHLQIIKKV